jgi:DNA polymerase-3 subunit delta'
MSLLEAVLGQSEGVSYLLKVIDGTFTLPLLLVGPQGVGRRLSVLETIKAVFERTQHHALERGCHPDFHQVRVEDDSDIKVDAIRALLEETLTLPSWGPYRFFLIDGADRLTIAAANALLKVLEEPPLKARFFLLSEQLETVMPTIRSRCAVVPYRPLPESLLLSRLLQITDDKVKAHVCARASEGSLGWAMRCLVSGQLVLRDEMTVILDHTWKKDFGALFAAVDKVADLPLGLCFLGQLLRDVLLVNVAPEKIIHLDITETLKRMVGQVQPSVIHRLLAGLRTVRQRALGAISLPFHVKSVLASCST